MSQSWNAPLGQLVSHVKLRLWSDAQHTCPVEHESALEHWTVAPPPSGHDASQVPTPVCEMQHDIPMGQPLMRHAGRPASKGDPLLLLAPPLLLLPPPLPLPLPLALPASFPEFELVDPPHATATATAPPNHTLTKRLTFFIREPLSEKRWWRDPSVRARPCRVSPSSPAPTVFFRRSARRARCGLPPAHCVQQMVVGSCGTIPPVA
jgi:hypothetical protein